MKEYYTLSEVARIIEVKIPTLRKQVVTGKRPHFKKIAGRYLIKKADIKKDFTDEEIVNKKININNFDLLSNIEELEKAVNMLKKWTTKEDIEIQSGYLEDISAVKSILKSVNNKLS